MASSGRRLRFLADFDFKPTPRVTIGYRAGQVAFVKAACAERALKLGKAELVNVPHPPAGLAVTIAAQGRKAKHG